jgi:hemerythrin-like domain-containing protein
MPRTRFNIYRDGHKALRLLLAELVERCGRTDFGAADELERLRSEVALVFNLVRSHTRHEDTFLGPLLQLYCPEVSGEVVAGHAQQEAELKELVELLQEVDAHRGDAAQRGHEVCLRLSSLVGELLQHMSEEEQRVMPALWQKLSDKTLQTVSSSLTAHMPAADRSVWLKAMLRALNRPERLELLGRMRSAMSRGAFEASIESLRAELRGAHDSLVEDLRLLETSAA